MLPDGALAKLFQPDAQVVFVFAGQVALDELAVKVGGALALEVGGLGTGIAAARVGRDQTPA